MTVRQAEMLLAAIIAARATSFMFSKILVGTMAPFNILAVRFLIAAGLLIVLFHRRLLKLDRRTLGCGAAMGGVFFASMALEMHALTGGIFVDGLLLGEHGHRARADGGGPYGPAPAGGARGCGLHRGHDRRGAAHRGRRAGRRYGARRPFRAGVGSGL